MCGILGRLALRGGQSPEAARGAVERRTLTLSHRGPDHSGVATVGDRLLLGHTRLSIIDPTSENDQPFSRGPLHLCFNGEIFNFKELRAELRAQGSRIETSGDCEVILAGYLAWGDDIFRRIKGMYAIALFDERDATLHLARDTFGIKPLYLCERDGALWFGSEIKAVVGAPRISVEGFADLLSLGYHFGRGTLYDGVTSLEPGTRLSLTIEASGVRSRAHADKPLWEIANGTRPDADLATCLRASIADHLIADVPVASTLSGGLDSSIVTALAKEADSDITAYTNTMWPQGDAETEHAAILAGALGIEHKVLYSPIDDLHATVAAISRHIEEPLVNSAVFNSYALAAQLRGDGYKVALVGEGSDELFGGYPWHALPLTEPSREGMFDILFAKRAVMAEPPIYLTDGGRRAMLDRKAEQTAIFLDEMTIDVGPDFNRFLLFDIRHQLVTMQLQRIDRLFMAHGIEARVPFLYDDVLRWAFHAPPEARLNREPGFDGPRRDKACLASAFAGLLPDAILRRPKFGKGGSANLGVTPPMKQWPAVFERVRSDARYAEARDVTSPLIDWTRLDPGALERKQQMFLSMLVMSVDALISPTARAA